MPRQSIISSPPHTDITGQRFGRLFVLGLSRTARRDRNRPWLCLCECGNLRHVVKYSLVRGLTVSCGCYRNERNQKHGTKHGMSAHPLYQTWIAMIQRCHSPESQSYSGYGGRGILVCDRWRGSIEAFIQDMGMPIGERHWIERIDNDGPYSPENCRWATPKEQSLNRRNTVIIEWNGSRRTAEEWSEITGIAHLLIRGRLSRGWPVERALTEPVGSSQKRRWGQR